MTIEASKTVECDDNALITRSIAGDQQSFELLYKKHVGRVYAICLRLCCDKDEAADAVQEVFIQVWKKLKNFKGNSAFSTWLYRIATNIALSIIRKRRPWWARFIDWTEASHETELTTNAQHYEHNLDKVIADLPEQARLVFVLFAIEGYRHEEIGRMLNIATGTSKAQYYRARQLLKEKIKHE